MECFVVGMWLFIMARVNWRILALRCARVGWEEGAHRSGYGWLGCFIECHHLHLWALPFLFTPKNGMSTCLNNNHSNIGQQGCTLNTLYCSKMSSFSAYTL